MCPVCTPESTCTDIADITSILIRNVSDVVATVLPAANRIDSPVEAGTLLADTPLDARAYLAIIKKFLGKEIET